MCQKPTFTGDRTPLRKRLSSDTADEGTFSVRELRSEEFVAATELKPSSFGVVEEPPENEHYIKINISRGVSIVSISEEENMEEPTHSEDFNISAKKSTNVYELNEEDELNLELNEKLPKSSSKESILKRHSKTSEDLLNTINKRLSLVENDSEINILSYDSSKKTSVVEETDIKPPQKAAILERQQSKLSEIEERIIARKSSLKSNIDDQAKKPVKAVSFDEQPSRIIDSENDDGCEELFKRIQAQRSILGEILEKQQESQNKALEERRNRRNSRQLSQTEEKTAEEPKLSRTTSQEKSQIAQSSETIEPILKQEKSLEKGKSIDEESIDSPRKARSFEVSDLKEKSIDKSQSSTEERSSTPKTGRSFDLSDKSEESIPEPQHAEVKERKTPQRGNSLEVSKKSDISVEPQQAEVKGTKTPQKGRSLDIAEKSEEVIEETKQPKEEPSPRRKFSRSSSKKSVDVEDLETPNKAEILDVSEKQTQKAAEPKTTEEKSSKTPQKGKSLDRSESQQKSTEAIKPTEEDLKTVSKGLSQEITDADEVQYEESDLNTAKISQSLPQKANKNELEKSNKTDEELDTKVPEKSDLKNEKLEGKMYDAENAEQKVSEKKRLQKVKSERSSTLESVPDLSLDEEKISKSKRASMAEEFKFEGKGGTEMGKCGFKLLPV